MWKLYLTNRRIINLIGQAERCISTQNYLGVTGAVQILVSQFPIAFHLLIENKSYFLDAGYEISEVYLTELLKLLLEAQEREDYVGLVDILKLQMAPLFLDVQEIIRSREGFLFDEELYALNMERLQEKDATLYRQLSDADVIHEKSAYRDCQYIVESTTDGYYALGFIEDGGSYYVNARYDAMTDAQRFAETYFDVTQEAYLGIGLGMGLHWEVLHQQNPDMKLDIVEPDIGVLQLAFTYMDMSWYFDSDGVTIHYDPDCKTMLSLLEDADRRMVALRPYIRHIRNEKVRHVLEECMLREDTIRQQKNDFYLNSKANFAKCVAYVDELESDLQGRTVVLVAGGPSLDKNIEELKARRADTVVIAVGTIFKKLLSNGIRPDYVVISDAKPFIYGQLEGLEEEQIPMILLSTAYRKIVENYQGKTYLACQAGYKRAEDYAKEHGYAIYNTGGSVITLALEIVIRMKAKRIICVGLDLAFTGNQDHAVGTYQARQILAEGTISVSDVDGNMVSTNRPFNRYRLWIERRLQEADVTMPVFDATEGGALIQGMQIVKLSQVLQ